MKRLDLRMDKYILQCPQCGKLFKCDKHNNMYVTDYGDTFKVNTKGICICINCNKEIKPTIMTTPDWVADC